MLLFPTVVSPTPGTSPEGQRVENARSKRETAENDGYKAVVSTVRAHQIFLNPGTQDPGWE